MKVECFCLLNLQSPDKAYDGDEENTTGGSDSASMVSSKSKGSLYDFDEEDPEPVKSPRKKQRAKKKKSPVRKASAPPSGGTPKLTQASTSKTTDCKTNVPKKPENNKVLSAVTPPTPMDVSPLPQSNCTVSTRSTRSSTKGKNVSFSHNVSEVIPPKLTPVVTLQKLDVNKLESSDRELRKRQREPQVGNGKCPKIKKTGPVLKAKGQKKEKSRDSGIYSPEVITGKNFKAQAMSTPCDLTSVPVEASLTAYRDPALLNVSPVQNLSMGSLTPLSDYASMDSVTHQLTFNDSSIADVDRSQTQSIELFTTEGTNQVFFKTN
jgi:hypothetical protein